MKGTISPELRKLMNDPKKFRKWVEDYFKIKFQNQSKK